MVIVLIKNNTLCAKPPDKNQEIGQDLRYTFLNSSWHTDAKKIPEKLIHRRPLACFFPKNQFFLKIFFLAKTHLEGPKIGCSQKNFFCKMTRKTLRKISHRKKAVKFFLVFLKIFIKIFFLLEMIFGPFRWILAKKNWFFEKNMLGGASRPTFQVFF